MTAHLEERLHAAGSELDRRIDLRARAKTCIGPTARPPGTRPVWTLALASCSAVLLAAGLVWLTGRGSEQHPVLSPTNDTSTVVAESTIAPAVAADSTTSPPTTVAPTATTVPYGQRPPIAVGESVMLGAQPQLEAGGFTVYAKASQQADWTATVIAELRAAHSIGSTIVVQVGTNGPVTADDYDAIMAQLPANEVPTVVFLTVHAQKSWIALNNELVRELPARYPNVTSLDWEGLAAQIADELSSDGGVHLRTDYAKQFYANYIFSAIGRNDLVQPLP